MLYGFAVAPSINHSEPSALYFQAMEVAAQKSAAQDAQTPESAMALCEYLDCVDSGAMASKRPLYAQAVACLSDYFEHNPEQARDLSQKSWAAKTLLDLVMGAKAQVHWISTKKSLRA